MNQLETREAQARALANGNATEKNSIEEAGEFPNRFRTLSFFFEEGDGVEIVQDLDNEEEDPEVYYFFEGGREQITEGALFEWAIKKWGEE